MATTQWTNLQKGHHVVLVVFSRVSIIASVNTSTL